jgi:DNA-binding transcriptional LysR family regulator
MMRAPMNLNRLAYFAAVVDAGSFTGAAERLGLTKAVVSQQVAKLEQDLGTSLLVRTTRRVHPTEAGQRFYTRCTVILRESEDAFDEMAQGAVAPTGLLRLTAPFDYGMQVVVPAVTDFLARYPSCTAELTLTDQTLDLVAGNIDMAIRVGWLTDSSLQARRIGGFRQLLVAAPTFAAAVAACGDPQDLATLPFIGNRALRDPLHWPFSHDAIDRRAVRFRAALSIDTTLGVHAAVMAGAGLSVLPDFLVEADLVAGRLLAVLPEWGLPAGGIHAVFPAARFRPAKVSAFVDLLGQRERARDRPVSPAP